MSISFCHRYAIAAAVASMACDAVSVDTTLNLLILLVIVVVVLVLLFLLLIIRIERVSLGNALQPLRVAVDQLEARVRVRVGFT